MGLGRSCLASPGHTTPAANTEQLGGKPDHTLGCVGFLSCSKYGASASIPVESGRAPTPDCRAHPMPLFYVERGLVKDSDRISDTSTLDTVSAKSGCTTSVTRTMNVLQAPGHGIVAMPLEQLDKNRLGEFRARLERSGIDTECWGVKGAKSISHLFWEVYEQRGCIIIGGSGQKLKRVTRIVKIRLVADVFGVEHALFSRLQFMYDGQTIERKQVPLIKLAWANWDDKNSCSECDERFFQQDCPFTEDWKTGTKKALSVRLGLSERWQEQHLEEDVHSYAYRTEDDVVSKGYPGLNTLYAIHEVTLRIIDPGAAGVHCIGLPSGQEFATTEGDFNVSRQQDEDGLPIGTQLNIWTWAIESSSKAKDEPVSPKSTTNAKPKTPGPYAPPDQAKLLEAKQVPLPQCVAEKLNTNISASEGELVVRTASFAERACRPLAAALEGRRTDWTRARQVAKRIADADYSLSEFNNDISCFPELDLYLLDEDGQAGTTSGRTLGVEYQRTVGAFFAIYWLMRLNTDGKDGFSFGVDAQWKPLKVSSDPDRLFPAEKRVKFWKESQWDYFERLLCDAGLLEIKGKKRKVNEKRVVTLLALTAIHDIMKVQALLPVVQEEHSPYQNYLTGDTIGDHDIALSYVMDHFPELLPSFHALEAEEKRSVSFTQCQLCFNHGWLVQAEAPPGAIFTKFRELLIRDHKSQIKPRDIALYFVHWLTDLSGAEPTPLGGCEKFVVKFPLPVLNSFLRSFEFVQKIAHQAETEVMEEYLLMRWNEHVPPLGAAPSGADAIAKMRLMCMAQMNAPQVLKAYALLSSEDQEVLNTEMARTGCMGQSFSSKYSPKSVLSSPMGPAILIYYGPAFLQNLGNDNATERLGILAEIYRCARELWPASIDQVKGSVIVRVDTIKALSTKEMLESMKKGEVWLLVKHNESEAFIERSSKKKLNQFIANQQSLQILDISVK